MDIRALELATAAFYDWELLGRGWRTYSYRVPLEPPFRPFPFYRSADGPVIDDARKPTFISSLVDRLVRPRRITEEQQDDDGPLPPERAVPGERWLEFEVLMPPDERVDRFASETFLSSLGTSGPFCFELLGSKGRVSLRFSAPEVLARSLASQLKAFFPQATVRNSEPSVVEAWSALTDDGCAAVEFGLSREFMVPLRSLRPNPDPLTPFVGAIAGAAEGSVALLQVLFEPVRAPWDESVRRAVLSSDGEPFFLDAPEITTLAEEKLSTSLYAVVLRALVGGEERIVGGILAQIANAFNQYAAPDRNSFVPLGCENAENLAADILTRSTHRSGCLLSLDELSSIVRLPSEYMKSAALLREVTVEKPLPAAALSAEGVILGEAIHRGKRHDVRLPVEARLQHMHIVGASGTGKSTLLQRLILEDIADGRGVGVIDPHGDLVDEIMAHLPEERIDDVVLFDPSDDEGIVGWNILGAHSEIEKELLSSDLVSVFRRLSRSWGDQMSVILGNAVLAFLESSRGGTLIELRKFLLDDAFRESFLGTVGDDHVVSFWREEFPLLVGKKPQAPILTRLDTFLRSKLIRERVTEREKPLDFREIIDTGKIFLAKLSQGAIGEENAALLGSLIVSKFHQVSLSRQNVSRETRRPFFLFLDEFQEFATPSMAGLFSGVRKYHLALTVAHQDLYQLHANAPELERSTMTNAYTRVVFRVSDEDARKLERGLGDFTAEDLTNLSRGEAVCRLGRSGDAFRLTTRPLPPQDLQDADQKELRIRRTSSARWGRPRIAPPAGDRARNEPEPKPKTEEVRPPKAERLEEKAAPPPMPGRGGTVHKYLQGLIGEWARTHGFKAEIEETLPSSGRVDVALTRDDLRIACEVAGTTTIEQETGNLTKCLAAGFTEVAAVSLDRPFLRKLEAAAEREFGETERARLHFFSPEELLAFLGAQMMTHSETRVAGYRVEVRHAAGAQHEADRKRTIAEVMVKSMRRMREKP